MTTPTGPQAQEAGSELAHWKVGRFYSSADRNQIVLVLAVGSQIEEHEKHYSFIEWVYAHYHTPPARVVSDADSLRQRLQRQCSEWGAYWRAQDAHGVELTEAQAVELLAEVLGVEVEIKEEMK